LRGEKRHSKRESEQKRYWRAHQLILCNENRGFGELGRSYVWLEEVSTDASTSNDNRIPARLDAAATLA
jgi:hypothetical protein